jgi:hypothetical protein
MVNRFEDLGTKLCPYGVRDCHEAKMVQQHASEKGFLGDRKGDIDAIGMQ